MPTQYNTTRQDTISRWQITILHCPALYPSPASSFSLPLSLSLFLSPSLSLSFFLPLSLSLYLSQPQSRRTLAPAPAPAPAPMILHMMQSSLQDGTLSMHAFLLLLLLFLLLLGHFDWMFLPLPLSRLASLRSAVSRFFLSGLASPLSACIIGLHRLAWLWLLLLLFSISYSILLYFIPPYSCSDSVIVYHTAYCNGLAQLIYWPTDRHTDIETDRAWHDMMWCDVMWWSTVPCTCTDLTWPDLTWPDLTYATLPYLTLPFRYMMHYDTVLNLTGPDLKWMEMIRYNMI